MKISLFCLSVLTLWSLNASAQSTQPTNLKCEYLTNPIGIDAISPRFTWQLKDNRTGATQSGYQIFVGTDSVEVKSAKGNYWQTAKVNSSKNLVTYQGKALQPFTKYYWFVQLWDKNGKSINSLIATFETGMMGMQNWKGYWISDDNDIKTKPAAYYRKTFQPKNRSDQRGHTLPPQVYMSYILTAKK